MPRTFLIDAHNALFRLLGHPPENADAARHAILERAREALRCQGASTARAHLVFDTTPAAKIRVGTHGRDGPLSWSYADGSADEEILRLVRGNGARDADRRIAVVTDDRELRGRCRQLGAETLGVRAWFVSRPAVTERGRGEAGPPLTAEDFGFTRDLIDLDRTDPDAL